MSDFINTFSYSFKCDLNKPFEYSNEYIQNFLNKLQEYIQDKSILENIKNYKELKDFLGKKRNFTEEEDINNSKKYFKKDIKSQNISVFKDENEDITLKLKEKDKIEIITIYNNPIAIAEIYDQNSMNINLINDTQTFSNKYNSLIKFNYKLYSLNNNSGVIYKKDIDEIDIIKTFQIQNEIIRPYLFIMKSKIPEIKNLENIYPEDIKNENNNDKIYPKNISKYFFYYFNINTDLQDKYIYINSLNRKKLFKILSSFLSGNINKVMIICGSKGIGKTVSLIKFSFIKYYNIFYFNLETYNRYINEDIRIMELKIQLKKLFGDFIYYDHNKVKEEIEKYIDENKNKNCLDFIYDIITSFLKFTDNLDINASPFCFIIDQYSFKSSTNDENIINKIIIKVKTSKKIKLIICPTINNIFAKKQIDYLFDESLKIEKYLKVYYFQELISEKEMKDNILNNENEEYLNFMEEVGFIPKLFYDSKLIDINSYKDYLKMNLKNNLNEYFVDNKDIIQSNTEILTLLDIIKGERLICSNEIKNNISKYSLKYLKIVKYKIDKNNIKECSEQHKINIEKDFLLKYISFLFTNCKTDIYDNIIENYFQIEDRDIKQFFDNYYERDNNSVNIYGNYYETFLNKNTKFFPLNLDQKFIYVYKLEFSMLLFEDIIYEYIYDNLRKEYNFLINIFDKGANGGFFEVLVDYYIKSNKSFIINDIKQIFYITSIVPQNYSIKYYSSKRKSDNFVEFELKGKKEKKDKKRINFENTYIKQVIFNSKYYDMAILIKSSNDLNKKTFKLIVIQASIRKEPEKRMTKDEHELILGIVKQNIENEFDVNIEEACFIYVLSQKDKKIEDIETKNDCDKNGIAYIGFDIEDIKNINENKNNKYIINLSKAFITKLFPIHNSASLLSYPKKRNDEYSILKELINNNLQFSQPIKKDDFNTIKNIIQNKYEKTDITENQFKYFNFTITNQIGDYITNYLTEFCFLIINITKNENDKKIDHSYMFAFGNTYELKDFKIIKPFKISKNLNIKFFYSKKPLKLIKNE